MMLAAEKGYDAVVELLKRATTRKTARSARAAVGLHKEG